MIARASAIVMWAGRCSISQRGVAVIPVLDAALYTMRQMEVPLGAVVLRLLVPGVVVGLFIDHC